MKEKPQYFALISAAGSGARFGSTVPKQYLNLKEQTVIEFALAPFIECSKIKKIVVILAPEDRFFKTLSLAQHPKLSFAVGADLRQGSVLNGLLSLKGIADEEDWVLVHDAARPCLSCDQIEQLIEAIGDDPVGGLLVAPLAETIKRVRHEKVVMTIPREELARALTPQQFRYGLLVHALKMAENEQRLVTDEATSLEALGLQPKAIWGDPKNIKITYPEDLKVMETLLEGV